MTRAPSAPRPRAARAAWACRQVFYRLDEGAAKHTLFQACFEALGSGMLVLMLLDAVRLLLGIPFQMKGELWACTDCRR